MTELAVICKHCGAEVSPYITECPYCGQRLRKRAPKLRQEGEEHLAPKPSRLRRRRRGRTDDDRPLAWLSSERRYGTIALVLAAGIVYLVVQASNLNYRDVGALIGPLDQDWWRLGAAQFVYENVGYMLAVGIAVAIFGSSLEGRYGLVVPVAIFLAAGAVGVYLVDQLEDFPIAFGGNGAGLGLLCAWLVRDLRDRRAGYDTESDLLGVAVIAAVLAAMPLLETTASEAAAAGGAVTGALLGLALPQRQ
jgi:membrane associated rhomboid family serine protease/ribosomal protein L40E